MRHIIIDIVGGLFIGFLGIFFGTNFFTTEYNIWALIAKFGGAAPWQPSTSGSPSLMWARS